VHRLLTRGLAAAALIAAHIAAGSATNPASAAAPLRECGNYGYIESTGTVGWTSRPISGAGTFNVTTRNVTCATARRFVLRYRGTDSYFPTWRCRETNDYEFSDVRCTSSRGRVIHWQAGA
jgi:hypothetical protein